MSFRSAVSVSIALLSFVAVSAAVRTVVPLPAGYGLRAKLQYIADHPNEHDTLFVGSSILFRGIHPEAIQRTFAKRGETVEVLNLGIPGLHAFEMEHLLHHLAEAGVSADRLFIEHLRRQIQPLAPAKLTDRSIYWRTLPVTWSALRTIALADRSLREKLTTSWLQLRLMMRRYSNYATGPEILKLAFSDDDTYEYLRETELFNQHGYQDPDSLKTEKAAERRRLFLEQREMFKARVQNTVRLLETWNDDPDPERALERYDTESVERQFAEAEEIADEVVVVLPPTLSSPAQALALEMVGAYPRVLHLCDPLTYPVLYGRDLRFDHAHLNLRGAQTFSRALVNGYFDPKPRVTGRRRPAERTEGN